MKKITILSALAALLLSLTTLAEEQRIEKRVIVTTGDSDEMALAEIMEMVETEIEGEEDINVFVTVDEDGEVSIEKMTGGEGRRHRMKAMKGVGMGHGPFTAHPCGMAGPHCGKGAGMTEGAAECVLKNIRNAASDHAAMAVVQACRTLSPE